MLSSRLPFTLHATATGSAARAGTMQTLHGPVQTPLFMPVGTQATVKAQLPESLEASGSQILLANTYHLLLRPGPEVFRRLGGYHGLTSWKRSVLTDSGGFQIFSLPHSRAMTEEGARFQSYLDGRTILLSPEVSIETQKAIGSDIMMVLDQCIPSTADEAAARAAWGITHRWAKRSLDARGDSQQALFAIVQGALFPELRRESAARLTEMPFDGFAIGGLAVGEEKHEREDICELSAACLPADQPRYLMGVGTPLDLLEAVYRGVDMFDCIIPTQMAQRGGVFTSKGTLQMRRGVYKYADVPLDHDCPCPTCARYSRAYLHHLTKCGETLGWQLLGQHNVHFYHSLMRDIRASILDDTFLQLYRERREVLDREDLENPPVHPKKTRQRRRDLGAYVVHTAQEGFSSIQHAASGEIMHARTPPMEEARAIYVEQSHLAMHLRLSLEEAAHPLEARPLVLWDIGLGAAANAMAAIECYEATAAHEPVRPMRIISFENDLDALRLALNHRELFTYLRHGGPAGLLERGNWQCRHLPGLSWQLVQGDFRETMSTVEAEPDVIFFDMFSGKVDEGVWSYAALQQLFAACRGRAVELFTYADATAKRAALLAAGFHVARGVASGVRRETTVALTPAAAASPLAAQRHLLGPEWLARWERSQAPYPTDVPLEGQPAFARLIREHAQFAPPETSIPDVSDL